MDEQVKMVMDGMPDENLKCLIGIRYPSSQCPHQYEEEFCETENFDMKNAMPMKLGVSDLVLKIRQKNLDRKEVITEQKSRCLGLSQSCPMGI